MPEDMFLQVKGEGLNVGCILTWGPCYDYQRQFFEPRARQAERAAHRAQVRRRGQRLRLAGARARLPAEPPRPDLPGLGRDRDEGLADLDHAGAALGQGPGGGHRLRPLRPRAWRSTRRPPPGGCSPRSTRDADGSLTPRRGRPGPPARRTSRRSTPTSDGVLTRAELEAAHERAAETPAEPRDPGDERRRRDGDLRHGRRRASATSSAPWTRRGSPSGTAGITC